MDTFPSQPDEGYSEDPLNPSSAAHHASLAEMPDWLTSQLPRMPLSIKKSTILRLLSYPEKSSVSQALIEAPC